MLLKCLVKFSLTLDKNIMIVTTKCATRLKNLETTRLPRNIFGRLTAYILISRQIFFKNSQRSTVNSKTRKPPFWLLRDLAFKRWNLFPSDKSIKTQKHFGCHVAWHPKNGCEGVRKTNFFRAFFVISLLKKEVVEEKTTTTTTD